MELNIVQLDRHLPDEVVITAHWESYLRDGEYLATSYGAEGFNRKSPDDPDFIPYEDLTPEIVKGWVMDKIGEQIQDGLEAQIEAQKHPTSASGLPWETEVVEDEV